MKVAFPTAKAVALGRRAGLDQKRSRSWERAFYVQVAISIVLLLVALIAAIGFGAVRISPEVVISVLLQHAGFDAGTTVSAQQDAVVWVIRLPRVILAALVGAGLAMAGAALQGIFRNPLADPGLIGVSGGASLAAVATIVIGLSPFGLLTLPVAAVLGGLICTLIVYSLARRNGRSEITTLILSGVAVNSTCLAGVGFLSFLATDAELRTITFWTLGSLGGTTWRSVGMALPFLAVGLLLTPRWSGALNLIALGEREARHLGVATEQTRFALIVLTAFMAGAAVAAAGTIAFIGLVVPHVVRLVSGPDHRSLLPLSALSGATILVLADLLARTVAAPQEVPLGVLTSLAGGPFFLWLVHLTRRRQGGWG